MYSTNALQVVDQLSNSLGVKYVGFYNGFQFDAARRVDGGVEIDLVDFGSKVIECSAVVSYEKA